MESASACRLVLRAALNCRHTTFYLPLVLGSSYARPRLSCIAHNAGDPADGGCASTLGELLIVAGRSADEVAIDDGTDGILESRALPGERCLLLLCVESRAVDAFSAKSGDSERPVHVIEVAASCCSHRCCGQRRSW